LVLLLSTFSFSAYYDLDIDFTFHCSDFSTFNTNWNISRGNVMKFYEITGRDQTVKVFKRNVCGFCPGIRNTSEKH